jgi:hypothetical protein
MGRLPELVEGWMMGRLPELVEGWVMDDGWIVLMTHYL